ncbi:thiamine-phosphate kinase [Kineobactrum sediminis]|uniref:Thiamine-monophosphate kinase n=1 Tax=Kineobactrum sediminis TaxID=1905677 RepID=A0A2N5Y013_9GAMM|nr:thiamine-phosphate kinase [Kineobactrum sediminis]PLW81738.1 thiamine-phosphate kinase [Kineobactrum sediminis]
MPANEFTLIARYFSAYGRGAAVELGVGDDCAILALAPHERLATSVDTVVAGRHFPEESLPEDVGFRAVAAAASDLAGMGARPLGMTLALTLPEADELWLHSFSQGVAAAAVALELPLVGGDTTRGPLTISVQVLGALPAGKALLRSGAQVGDGVYVSGTLGDAGGGLAILEGRYQPEPEAAEYLERRFFRPLPPLALGALLLDTASAAIDISDGLLADAGHIAAASGVRIEIDRECLPLSAALQAHPDREQALAWALSAGDDYELCFCLPEGSAVPRGCTRVGAVLAGAGVVCAGAEGLVRGYQHF